MTELLRAWREAEMRWIGTPPDDPEGLREAALDVVRTWLAYQEQSGVHADALVLVADAEGRYVAAGGASEALLGHPPADIVGTDISSISAAGSLAVGPELWDRFLETGRQDGAYELLHRDGRVIRFGYVARAHFPVAGFHTSVLTSVTD
jgi:PAS domain-containing protein